MASCSSYDDILVSDRKGLAVICGAELCSQVLLFSVGVLPAAADPMAGRSFKGHVADCSTGFLRFLNIILLLGAVAEIVLVFVMEGNPSFPAGWGFIVVGLVTVASGLCGVVSKGNWGCLGLHLFFTLLSTAGLATSFLVIFVAENKVIRSVGHGNSGINKHDLLLVIAAICAALFCLQIIMIVLYCCVQNCGFVDYYEDLDGNPRFQAQMAKQRAKDEAATNARRSKIEASSAHQLAEKMKAKYGAYNADEQYSQSQV